jgi:hypothetical protein
MPGIMRDIIHPQLSLDSLESGNMRHTNQDNIWSAFLLAKAGHVQDSVVGLDDLVRNGNVSTDEDVNVGFCNLGHNVQNVSEAEKQVKDYFS